MGLGEKETGEKWDERLILVCNREREIISISRDSSCRRILRRRRRRVGMRVGLL
jgi:hypothetical protein